MGRSELRGDYCEKCSSERNRIALRMHKAARRVAAPERLFDPQLVFERYGWRCYICGVSTPPALRGRHEANSPELDHILPLSRGGAHIPANTACCCRKCNGQKNRKTLGEFIAWRGGANV